MHMRFLVLLGVVGAWALITARGFCAALLPWGAQAFCAALHPASVAHTASILPPVEIWPIYAALWAVPNKAAGYALAAVIIAAPLALAVAPWRKAHRLGLGLSLAVAIIAVLALGALGAAGPSAAAIWAARGFVALYFCALGAALLALGAKRSIAPGPRSAATARSRLPHRWA